MHGLAFDDLHDEIVVPVALSGAVLVFRGGATGDEAPLRVIQGSKTGMIRPQTVEVDPVHNEIVAADSSSRAILIYDRMANGNVEPIRKIGGSKTLFRDIIGIAIDPKRNLIIASTRSTDGFSGILMFDRMANGDVAPVRKIGGSMTGALGAFRQLKVDSDRGTGVPRRPELPPCVGDAPEGRRPLYKRGVAQEAAGAGGRQGGARHPRSLYLGGVHRGVEPR